MNKLEEVLNNLTVEQILERVNYYFNCPQGGYRDNRPATKSLYWYRNSYPLIINEYVNTRCNVDDDDTIKQYNFTKRIAYVYSWLGNANTCNLEIDNINKLIELENNFNNEINGELIESYVNKLSLLLNGTSKNRIASISKYLHFAHPSIFPILDSRVSAALNLNNNISLQSFIDYCNAIRTCLQQENEIIHLINTLANDKGVSNVRIIDVVLF